MAYLHLSSTFAAAGNWAGRTFGNWAGRTLWCGRLSQWSQEFRMGWLKLSEIPRMVRTLIAFCGAGWQAAWPCSSCTGGAAEVLYISAVPDCAQTQRVPSTLQAWDWRDMLLLLALVAPAGGLKNALLRCSDAVSDGLCLTRQTLEENKVERSGPTLTAFCWTGPGRLARWE